MQIVEITEQKYWLENFIAVSDLHQFSYENSCYLHLQINSSSHTLSFLSFQTLQLISNQHKYFKHLLWLTFKKKVQVHHRMQK